MAVTPPFAHRVNRVTVSGSCFNGAEEWTTGFYLGNIDSDAPDPQDAAAKIAPVWQQLWNGGGSSMFGTTYLTREIKVSQIKTDGKTDLDAIDYYTYPSAIAGGGATRYPPQVAMVVTLTSNVQRGLGSKGRMYLPGITFGIDGDTGKLTSGTMTAVANTMKTFYDGINALTGVGSLILASHGHRLKDAAGNTTGYSGALNTAVSGMRVGDVLDTQRRRRDDLQELYTARTLNGFF